MQQGVEAGNSDFFASKILGSSNPRIRFREQDDRILRDIIHDRRIGDSNQIKSTINGLKQNRRGRAAKLQ